MTTSQGATYNFIYDTTAGIPAVLVEKAATQDAKLYIRTPDGRLIARVTATETPTLDFYYHFDGLGSTIALTDADGNRITTYDYGLWGGSGGGLNTQPYQYVGQLGYYTHYQEPKLSYGQMLQLGVRYYEPGLGRFTQRDPLSRRGLPLVAQDNPYTYSEGSPLLKTDANGLYATKGNCNAICPDLSYHVERLVRALDQDECRRAIKDVKCTDFFDKMKSGSGRNPLQGITLECKKLDHMAECGSSRDITIDCKGSVYDPAAILSHELTHACAWNANRSPNPSGPWTCPTCGDKWENADPVWEASAEKVLHACFK